MDEITSAELKEGQDNDDDEGEGSVTVVQGAPESGK